MKSLTLLLIAVIYIACSSNNPIEPTTDTTFDFTLKGSNYDSLELRFSMTGDEEDFIVMSSPQETDHWIINIPDSIYSTYLSISLLGYNNKLYTSPARLLTGIVIDDRASFCSHATFSYQNKRVATLNAEKFYVPRSRSANFDYFITSDSLDSEFVLSNQMYIKNFEFMKKRVTSDSVSTYYAEQITKHPDSRALAAFVCGTMLSHDFTPEDIKKMYTALSVANKETIYGKRINKYIKMGKDAFSDEKKSERTIYTQSFDVIMK